MQSGIFPLNSHGPSPLFERLNSKQHTTGLLGEEIFLFVNILEGKKASLEILDQKIDTGTASGKAFLQMLGVFAEFETNLWKERQLAGIAAAKKAGRHLGRRPLLNNEQKNQIKQRYLMGENPTVLSKKFSVSRATIYNVINS